MLEVEIEDFSEVYRERLNEIFYKERKTARKILSKISD